MVAPESQGAYTVWPGNSLHQKVVYWEAFCTFKEHHCVSSLRQLEPPQKTELCTPFCTITGKTKWWWTVLRILPCMVIIHQEHSNIWCQHGIDKPDLQIHRHTHTQNTKHLSLFYLHFLCRAEVIIFLSYFPKQNHWRKKTTWWVEFKNQHHHNIISATNQVLHAKHHATQTPPALFV